MATEERLPPACAFAISVLAERDIDPEAVPEEAVEAAQLHMATCTRCLSSDTTTTAPRKKKKVRRVAESDYSNQAAIQTLIEDPLPALPERRDEREVRVSPAKAFASVAEEQAALVIPEPPSSQTVAEMEGGSFDCQQCRQVLPDYAEALDSGQNAAMLFPEVQEHLLTCESGCLVLLDLLRQEAKATRKYRRRPVRDPFSVMWWQFTGFFRGGRVPMSPMALSYGTLILLVLVSTLCVYLSIRWDDARHYVAPPVTIPTPDGIGISDGLKIYDACNAVGYRDKRTAAQLMQDGKLSNAEKQLTAATDATLNDTGGCNGAEASIYREDLHVRQSGRPFSIVVVSFDSGPGNADPQGGTDRHILYGAYTQELVGAFIGQQQYNTAQMQTPDAPLLYLVLANTTGAEQGALQVANSIASLAHTSDTHTLGLLASGIHPLTAVLGLGPSKLVQVVLPVMCRVGVPLIAPTSTGLFIIDLLTRTSLYRHCTPGFAFIRFSPDDARQSTLGASYAYNQLHARNAAIFYDPSNPSSQGSAQGFIDSFSKLPHTTIVAQETAVASGLLDSNGHPQASRDDLLAGLDDALKAKTRPDLIFAPLLTNDVVTLGQAIARLPQQQQPILMIGGEFVQPTALQGLVQWARQQQLALPRVFVAISSAVRPPTQGDWQKQFYASFCTSFATPGSFCSGAAALDQGALLFADGIKMITNALGPVADVSKLPTPTQFVQHVSTEQFAGVSCPIALQLHDNVVTSTKAVPVILGIQDDGSIQIVG